MKLNLVDRLKNCAVMPCSKTNGKQLQVLLYKKIFYKKMSLIKPQNLNKMFRKSPASNAWAAIFKNADFS